jgi:hypothetical protein
MPAEKNAVPVVPRLGIQHPRRRPPQGIPKGVIAQKLSRIADVRPGPELHQLAQEEIPPLQRALRGLPPDVLRCQRFEGALRNRAPYRPLPTPARVRGTPTRKSRMRSASSGWSTNGLRWPCTFSETSFMTRSQALTGQVRFHSRRTGT